jgi:hypothetical protein
MHRTLTIDRYRLRRLQTLLALAALLFALHLYLLLAIVFGTAGREDALRRVTQLETEIITAEMEYMALDASVSRELASARGYVDAGRTSYFVQAADQTVALNLR